MEWGSPEDSQRARSARFQRRRGKSHIVVEGDRVLFPDGTSQTYGDWFRQGMKESPPIDTDERSPLNNELAPPSPS
jgi:hypothetical protein